MDTSQFKPADQTTMPATTTPSLRRHSSNMAWVAFAVSIFALISSWVSTYAGPRSAKAAIARGDYEGIFTVQIILWAIMLVCQLAAIVLGIVATRRPVGKVLAGVAIGIGASGVLGWLVYMIQSDFLGFIFY